MKRDGNIKLEPQRRKFREGRSDFEEDMKEVYKNVCD
jgi:hypothetical protein